MVADFRRSQVVGAGIVRIGVVATLFEVGLSVAVAVERAHGIGRIGGQQGADIEVCVGNGRTTIVGVVGVSSVVTFIDVGQSIAIAVG